jgi:hypothetical protein
MKKHLLLACLVSLLTPLAAENVTICQLFEKLLNHANDFKPLMAGKDPSLPIRQLSTIQLEGAVSSRFNVLNDVTFEAELGRYPSQMEAIKAQNKWAKALMECYPGMKFGFYELVFECKQAREETLTKPAIVAFTDYTMLTVERDDSPFTEALQEVLYQATVAFEEIKGNDEDDHIVGRYPATLKLPGYDNCYVDTEDNYSYVVSICKDVDKETLQAKLAPVGQQIVAALGKDYAYRLSKDGSTVYYVRGKDPDETVATLSYTVHNGLYSAAFIVWGRD